MNYFFFIFSTAISLIRNFSELAGDSHGELFDKPYILNDDKIRLPNDYALTN